ncbi:MAG: hypothetical protein O3A71_10365 [Proteobacteria bacterium]|nr:hypothetical protein [Pseudomonadota bacterium]
MMRATIFLLAVILMGAGCAKQDDAEVTAPVVADSEVNETAAEDGPDAYYEYLWCNQGEDFSQDKLAELTANWNAVIDGMDAPSLAAFGYIPRGAEMEAFDGLWVLRWDSKSDSAAGWEAYAASEAAQSHEATYGSVLVCGSEVGVNRFGFDAYIPQPMPASFTAEPAPYFLTNTFCAFNDGKGPEDLRKVVGEQYLPLLAAVSEANPESSYWFMIGAPDFEERVSGPFDFNWINYWQTVEEGEAAMTAFAASEDGQAVMASLGEVATCRDPQAWDGYLIRSNVDA